MSDVFREVDEIMRQERVEQFWKENATWIIAFVVLSIIFTGGFSYYRHWNKGQEELQTTLLIQTIESPDFPEDINKTAADLRAGHRALLLLTAGGSHQNNKDFGDAAESFKNVMGDSGIEPILRDLAGLFYVRSKIAEFEKRVIATDIINKTVEEANRATQDTKVDSTEADNTNDDKNAQEENSNAELKLDTAELLDILKSIRLRADNPWRFHAHLESALIFAHYDNDLNKARSHLKEILDHEAVPQSLKARARSLDHVYALRIRQKAGDTDQETSGEG